MPTRSGPEGPQGLPLWDVLAATDGSILWELAEKHVDYSDNRVARRRRALAKENNRTPGNNAPTGEVAALRLDILGARTECVGYLYLSPIMWHTVRRRIYNLPDLGDFIDVKGRDKDWYDLPIQKDDPDQWAYLLITQVRHPLYRIVSWCWGYEGKQDRFLPGPVPSRPAYFIPQGDKILKPPAELWHIVRSRRTRYNDLVR